LGTTARDRTISQIKHHCLCQAYVGAIVQVGPNSGKRYKHNARRNGNQCARSAEALSFPRARDVLITWTTGSDVIQEFFSLSKRQSAGSNVL